MSDPERRPRRGLEGLPINSDEVWMFDGARAGARMSDFVALIISWLAVVWLAVIAIWGRSVVLGLLAGLGFAFVVHWTIAKWRDRALAVRLQRRAGGDQG